ncbi:MAG TPA: HAMP domain-containing sensor histidine kinase [Solirubrobacteraceae bacterium]|jgi:two-component system OmpR family sensor kinase|nr:HAMP domain-containing sensor histidine kinase [Solirubrobacteraceae bacterium]
MSLRGRLLSGVLVITAVGLVAAGGGTYLALRSFLLGRVDQQLMATRAAVGRGQSSTATIDTTTLDRLAPPLAFVELRSPTGKIVALHLASSLTGSTPEPRLPAALHPPQAAQGGVPSLAPALQFDAPAVTGTGRYRVLVSTMPGSANVLIVAVSLDDVNATLHRLLRVELFIAAGLLALLAVATFLLLRRGLRPLERISEVASGIAQGDLDVRISPADERSEIGRLGLALNGMLERLEDAFGRRDRSEAQLRRFVSSASHELRTPLTSIRGYAELLRRGARHNPVDLDKSISRIESEATRMGGLIDDLLLLARLDEERPLARARVDLAVIAHEAADDARVRDPRRPITVDAGGPVVVIGDGRRLQQIVTNLLENAQVHTAAGTPVRIEVGVRDQNAVLAVIDTGAGIDPDQVGRVFERFYRGTPSASGDVAPRTEGSGLGLAIVKTIAEALGGTATVTSTPGKGSRFEITLPLA